MRVLLLVFTLCLLSVWAKKGDDDGEVASDPTWLLLSPGSEEPRQTDGPEAFISTRRNAAVWCDEERDAIYVYGGKNVKNGRQNELWKYEVPSQRWVWLPDPPAELVGRSGMAYWKDKDDVFWMYGGRSDVDEAAGVFDDLWSYDKDNRKWTQHPTAADGPGGRVGSFFWYHPSRELLYLYGGEDKGDFWTLDTAGVWTQVENVAFPRTELNDGYAIVSESKNLVYLFGGQTTGGETVNDFIEIDLGSVPPTVKTLTSNDQGPGARQDHIMWLSEEENQVFVYGGKSGDTLFGDTWVYDLVAEEWSQLQGENDSPSPRWGASICVGNRELLLFGGADTNEVYDNDVWKYGNPLQEESLSTLQWFFNELRSNEVLAASTLAATMSTMTFFSLLLVGTIWFLRRLCRRRYENVGGKNSGLTDNFIIDT